ncbi:MAG TPA: hypothetical protein VHA12_03065 [Candidatus Nanoarchaeia archaeon]|nr:hypothetical protein [Candidatus Nanoarchaeia archaeon]
MGVRGFFLFILSTLLVATTLLSAIGFNSLYLLKSETYTPYLEESGIYSQIQNIIPAQAGQVLVIGNETARAVVDMVVKKVFDYINGETDTLNITIDIDSKEVRDLLKQQITNLPVCQQGVDPIKDRVACRPEGVNVDQVIDQIVNSPQLSEIKTESIDLAQYINADGTLSQVRDSVAVYKKVIYGIIIAEFILIGLILWIGWNTRTRGLRNISIPITLAGISLFSTIYFGSAGLRTFIEKTIPSSQELKFTDLVLSVFNGIYSKFLITAIVVLLVGAILFTCSFIFVRQETEDKDKKEV